MATDLSFAEYVVEQLHGIGDLRYRKMFGDYMVYVNDKPIVLICDNTVFVKPLDCIADAMRDAKIGIPYDGAKERYILDIDNADFAKEIVSRIEAVTPLPKKTPKKKRKQP